MNPDKINNDSYYNYAHNMYLVQEQVEKLISEYEYQRAIIICIDQMGEKLASSVLYGILVRYFHKHLEKKLWSICSEALIPPYQGPDKIYFLHQQFINRFKLINYYRQITDKNEFEKN